jgi:PAS domain S-box-containing protein
VTATGLVGQEVPEEAARSAIRQALGAVSALVPVGLFGAEADGRCWYVNQRLVDSLGLEVGLVQDHPLRLEFPAPGKTSLRVPAACGAADEDRELDVHVMPVVRSDRAVAWFVGVVVDEDNPGGMASILRASERLVDTLLESSPDVITVLNEDGSWRYSTGAAWRVLGYQADFDPVDGVFSMIHPDDVPMAAQGLADVISGKASPEDTYEIRVRAADGSWRYFETLVDNLLDDPVVHGLVLRSRDVTDRVLDRRTVLETHERLATLIGSLHLAVLVEDEHRRIVRTNDAFVNLFEIPVAPPALAGQTLREIGPELFRRFGDPTRAPSPERTAEIIARRRQVVGDRLILPDERVIERDYLPITVSGEYRGHLWLFRDVSAQAQAEGEWEQLIATQRRENDRLIELDMVKAAFLAEISHELRTPLTSILSFTELLDDGLGKDDVREQAEFLEIIRRNADRLLRLVDDLLLLDRIETGAMPIEWGTVDLPSLVASSVVSFSPAADKKAISLESEIGDGPTVPGDAQRIGQLLDVLLSNALKFTPAGGRVLVTAAPRDRLWRIEVIDNGIGVPAAEQDSLFERFFRATNARTARIPGSGLGLPVARAIAELHGGGIVIRSSEGGGTTAVVTLPLAPRQDEYGAPAEEDTDEDAAAESRRVE